jgi:signal transduction histidine kinase
VALEEADEVKTRFLANMSYEFRTPLTSIGGFAELLASGAAGELSAAAGEYVDAILTSVARLTEQVENVLDLSQSEAGLLPIEKKKIDLLPFLTKIVRQREAEIVARGIGLDLKGKRQRTAMADPRQLERALGHLLDNAIAGTAEGGQILIELPHPIEDEKWQSAIVISDNGKGMSREALERAFAAAPASRNGELERRDGLGIPLARRLIEAHEGMLEITSEEGVGTTAVVLLP